MTPLTETAWSLPPKPPQFELRMSLVYSVVFAAMAIHLPFFPLWLKHAGFGAEEIGTLLAIPMFVRILAVPVMTALGDKARDRADVLAVLAALAALASLGYFLTPTYSLVLAISLVLAVTWTPHVPIVDSVAASGVRRYGIDYTRIRIWGSASFMVVNLVAGAALGAFGIGLVPLLLTLALGAMVAMAFVIPRLGRPRVLSPLAGAVLGSSPTDGSLLNRDFLLLAGGCGIITGSHGFVYGFSSIYWKSLGYGDTLIGFLWAWGVVAEVAMFALFPFLLGRANARFVIALGGAGALLRWVLFPLVWPTGAGVAGFFAVQTLHALSTGLMLIGLQKVMAERVPEEQSGSAQGVAYIATGTSTAVATLAAGYLYDRFGVGGFFCMALMAAAGTACALAAQPQRAGSGGKTSEPS